MVYIGTMAGTFLAFDLATGARRWGIDLQTGLLPMVQMGGSTWARTTGATSAWM
jgi:hypothetical protein